MSIAALLSDQEIEKVFKPKNIIQVGANTIQELGIYCNPKLKIEVVFFVEADPQNYRTARNVLLKNKPPFRWTVFNYALSDCEKPVFLYRFNKYTGANSIHQPIFTVPGMETIKNDLLEDPREIVKTVTLDNILAWGRNEYGFDTLVLDCQGSEAEVLRGAKETLKTTNFIIMEVWKDGQLGYSDSESISQIDKLLSDFTRIKTYWPEEYLSWGYAFYSKRRE